jgi:hypothetical protein
MMIRILAAIFIMICSPAMAGDLQTLEKEVTAFAEEHPDQAYEKFMTEIESGASTEEQAVYLYGIGLANEKLGNLEDAMNDYLGAEILGYTPATQALQRVRDKIGKDL